MPSGKNKKPAANAQMLGKGNRLQSTGQINAAVRRVLGYHLQAKQNADTCHPPSGELAVPANNVALTKNDIHDVDGLALLAPEVEILRAGGVRCYLVGFLLAYRANIPSILDTEFNSILFVLQYFSLQFFVICELFNYISRILILILK